MGLMDEWEASGRQVSYETVYRGYKATWTHKKYSKGLEIERELLEDALYPEVKSRTRTLADSLYYTRQYHAVRPFNECLSFIGPDGVPLASDSHPLGPYNATTWSNYGTSLTLNATNVEAVRNLMKEWTDDKGNLLLINPDTLIVPKALRKAALVVADTDKEPDTAENNVNIWKGSVNVIEWDFLTNSNLWILADMNRLKRFMKWFDRRKGILEKDREHFDTEVAKYKIVSRFSYGHEDASFAYFAVQ
jgi:hypothetical protein